MTLLGAPLEPMPGLRESRFQYSGADVQSSGVRQGSGIVMMAHGVQGEPGGFQRKSVERIAQLTHVFCYEQNGLTSLNCRNRLPGPGNTHG